MKKNIQILLVVGLVSYAILVGVFYAISVPVMEISFVKSNPGLARIFWLIILGGPLVLTGGVLKLTHDILAVRDAKRPQADSQRPSSPQ